MSEAVPTNSLVSVDEYLRTSYRPDVDFVDGYLVERNVGDYWHGLSQGLIAGYFNGTLRRRYLKKLWAIPEFRMEVRARTRYRVPDVAVLPQGQSRGARYMETPPLIAIEILSPDDTVPGLLARCSEYVKRGTPNVWLVDPRKKTVTEVDEAGWRIREDRRFYVNFEGEHFLVDFNEVFAEMEEA